MTWQLTVSGSPDDNSPEAQEAIADRCEEAVSNLLAVDGDELGVYQAVFASNDVSRDLTPTEPDGE